MLLENIHQSSKFITYYLLLITYYLLLINLLGDTHPIS